MNTPPRKYPNTQAELLSHTRWLTGLAYSLQDQINNRPVGMTKEQSDKLYGPAAIRPHLLAGGAHALTIENLLGVAAQPQNASIPITVDVLANIPTNFGVGEKNELFIATDVGHFFIWTGSAWAMLDGAGYGVFAVSSPIPTAFWHAIDATLGGTAAVTKVDGSGTTTVAFAPYTSPGTGYNLYVRL